ncbi:R-spondin-4-like isoform X1 [Betta splendens]|uniref:R-spondin-4-like isoform X1 n=1 Tax=Betta splendens TaxID=158456 RepID=A0A9W2XU41_BETSP|nr:R-spondin-4-like isoform X1 [Betta splendens]
MQPRLVAVAMSLVCEVIRMSSGLVQKQSAHREAADDCRACLECSRDNGCVRCPEKLFLFLQRDGMSHHGSCVHACPAGHYGQRGTDANRCMKCRSPDCEHCFSRDFCTKCKAGLQLYKGRCLSTCPEGTHAHQTDCRDDCAGAAMSEWSQWSTCLHDGAPCGFRWGKQTRSRNRTTEEKAAGPCWTHSETQRCRMKKKCPTEARIKKKDLEENEGENDSSCSPAAPTWATHRPEPQTHPDGARPTVRPSPSVGPRPFEAFLSCLYM